ARGLVGAAEGVAAARRHPVAVGPHAHRRAVIDVVALAELAGHAAAPAPQPARALDGAGVEEAHAHGRPVAGGADARRQGHVFGRGAPDARLPEEVVAPAPELAAVLDAAGVLAVRGHGQPVAVAADLRRHVARARVEA